MPFCTHGVSLQATCDKCAESYGNARTMPAEDRPLVWTETKHLRWNGAVLEQQWVAGGGAGPYEWRPVPTVTR